MSVKISGLFPLSAEERAKDGFKNVLARITLSVPAAEARRFPALWSLQMYPWGEDAFCLFLRDDGCIVSGDMTIGAYSGLETAKPRLEDAEELAESWLREALVDGWADDAFSDEPCYESHQRSLALYAAALLS